MQHTKRWLAAVLAMTMTLSDCGGMTVLATENTAALEEDSVSDNNAGISDKFIPEDETEESNDNDVIVLNPSEDRENAEIDPESDNAELPALHIGQIKKGEDLPTPDDDEFSYDLPVSFETSEQIVLFANYNLNAVLDEENGTLVWNILRSEKESEPGSTNLLDEEDDWTDFETVSASPFFVMEEITDEESPYYQMMALAPAAPSSAAPNGEGSEIVEAFENYNYYIRAAYYPETENGKDEAFYAAVTIPFVPQNTVTEDIQEDAADIEDALIETVSDNTITAEDTVPEEIQDKEAVDTASDDMDADDDDFLEDDEPAQSPESVSENSAAAEPLSTLSENEDDAASQPTKENFGVLTLNAESVTLHPGDTASVSAAVEPKSITDPILWESADGTIAAVDENGKITAVTAGYTQITATCGTLTASVKVNVINTDKDEVYDLSGDIWIAGFQKENEDLVYTGQKITQNFQVYYKETLLNEKTDYTLSYKNNINAAKYNDAKAPNVTIKMKGQYQGSATLYFTIYPANIKNLDIYNPTNDNTDENNGEEKASSGYIQTVNYSKNLKLPTPEITFGKKKLAVNKDFECDYTLLKEELQQKDYKKGDSYTPGKIYHYVVKGIGNYTGPITMQLVLLKNKALNFSSAAVTLSQKQYEYHGTALTEKDVAIKKLTINKKELTNDLYAYDVYADRIDNAYIMVYPSSAGEEAGYCGFKKVALKLVGDRKISDAAQGKDWKSEITFSQKTVNEAGGIFQNEAGELLTFDEGEAKESLIEGQDYTVKYTNAKKVGTVTATFTGKGRYKGTRKLKYTILPNTDKKNFMIRWKNVTRTGDALVITYQKGGAVPDFVLLDQDNNVLKNKTDYTVKLKDNKALGNMSCEITGKGNYKGYTETVQITVKNADISQCTLSVPDKAYSTKANAWKSKVTVKDVNGKTLAAGKDYEKEVSYSYTGMENEQPPTAGTIVTVTVKGMGFYANDTEDSSLTGSYRIFDKDKSISKLQIVIDNQEYTGKEVTLSKDTDIHVYATKADKKAKQELPNAKSCYDIIEYKNNIKAGTAKVTLRGIGAYGGTKTYSFKILKKAYLTNRVAKITLNKTKLNISIAEKGQRTLTATITPKDASQQLTNPTIIWTTSNSNIATVKPKEPAPDDKTDTKTETDNSISVTADITVQNAGTVKITAIAQDGNKKAVCTVKITVPALKEKNQTIRCKTGDTHQLKFDINSDSEIDWSSFKFESTNLKVASVTENGLVTMNRFGMVTIKVSVGKSVQQCSFIVERVSDDELTESNGVLTYVQKSGCKDDTAAINALLQKAENNPNQYDTVYIPAGNYHIDAVNGFGGIILRDNQNLIMSPNATLTAIANGNDGYHIIWAFGRSNVTISGGKIVGERNNHKGSTGEAGHGIEISGCKNVSISDVEVSYCWGDGIYLGFYDGPNVCSTDIIIENCNLHHNRRSNLSITDASNVTIEKCQFNNASGTAPQYGINIEPNPGRTCSNVTISKSTFKGNAGGTIQILGQLNAHVKGVKIENCTGDKEPLIWQGYGGSVSGVTQSGNNW